MNTTDPLVQCTLSIEWKPFLTGDVLDRVSFHDWEAQNQQAQRT